MFVLTKSVGIDNLISGKKNIIKNLPENIKVIHEGVGHTFLKESMVVIR